MLLLLLLLLYLCTPSVCCLVFETEVIKTILLLDQREKIFPTSQNGKYKTILTVE